MPESCAPATGTEAECLSSCPDLATYAAGCALELADYLYCIRDNVSPDAACMLTDSGNECYGDGCTTSAIDACAYSLEVYGYCTSGCTTSYSVDPGGCWLERYCLTHQYGSRCTQDPSGALLCTCSLDGQDAAKSLLYTDVSQACSEAESYCYYVR